MWSPLKGWAKSPSPAAKVAIVAVGVLALVSADAHAQILPAGPIVVGDGLVTLGGDVSASYGGADPGFFNYTDYEHSALRLFRAANQLDSTKSGRTCDATGSTNGLPSSIDSRWRSCVTWAIGAPRP